MKYKEVDKQTLNNSLREFLGDVGFRNYESLKGLDKFLKRRRWLIK